MPPRPDSKLDPYATDMYDWKDERLSFDKIATKLTETVNAKLRMEGKAETFTVNPRTVHHWFRNHPERPSKEAAAAPPSHSPLLSADLSAEARRAKEEAAAEADEGQAVEDFPPPTRLTFTHIFVT